MRYILLIILIISSSTKFLSFASTIEIKKSGGYAEGAYVEWTGPFVNYNVYIVSGTIATPLDNMLVRYYSNYYRADAVGLKAGKYTFRIICSSGVKETSAFTVTAFDRSGFHQSPKSPTYGKGMGAYNIDGTLKDGAQVLYVTEDNKKSVRMTINGVEYTGVASIAQQIKTKNKLGPVAIRVVGQVTLDGLESIDMAGSSAMGVKGASEVTIEGIGNDAILQCGIAVYESENIEIRNLGLMIFISIPDIGGIYLKSSAGVWVHNNDLYGYNNVRAYQAKRYGTMNLEDDTQYATIAYNHFWNNVTSSLCGMKRETGPNYISYHHNWFDHSVIMHPRIRSMSVHVYNNFYDECYSYGVGVTYNGEAFVESNYFKNVKYPMLISLQGSDKLIGGTFSGENGGLIKSFGNIIKSQKSYITYDKNKDEFDAYEVARRIDKVPINVVGKVGGKTYSNFDTNRYIMYAYTPDNANDVPTLVMNSAGSAQKGSQNTASKLLDLDFIKSDKYIVHNDSIDFNLGGNKNYTGVLYLPPNIENSIYFNNKNSLIPNSVGRAQKGSQNTTSKLLDLDFIKSDNVIVHNDSIDFNLGGNKNYTGVLFLAPNIGSMHFHKNSLIPNSVSLDFIKSDNVI